MAGRKDPNMIVTAIIVVIMYAGLAMSLFYGIAEEWAAASFSLLAAGVAVVCKWKIEKKRDRK